MASCLSDQSQTLDLLFRRLIIARSNLLSSKFHEKGDHELTELSKLMYTNLLRLTEQQIKIIFPHISQTCFDQANESNATRTLIKGDYTLMQYLTGDFAEAFQLEDIKKRMPQTKKLTIIYDSSLGRHIEAETPIVSKEHTRLFNTLRSTLAAPVPSKDSLSFLPDDLKKPQKRQKPSSIKKKDRKKGNNQNRVSTTPPVLLKEKKDSKGANPQSATELNLKPLTAVALEKKVKSYPSKPAKVIPPMGEWSLHDQQRSAEAKERLAHQFIAVPSTDVQQTLFRTASPIILNTTHYQALQEILAEQTPPYTLTFNQVSELLEAIGIKVDRHSGSHAHIHTPGHNLKTLVDIHYGWTDKYGPKIMKGLRTLMQNLGLDNPENVIEG